MRTMLTQAELKKLLHYDPNTGVFTRISGRYAGREAGYLHKGYICFKLCGRHCDAHRAAWLYMTGKWPKDEIDHRDLNRGNNRFSNLRESGPSGNGANKPKYRTNKSGFKGVDLHKQVRKWRAQITKDGRTRHIGLFDTKEEAHAAYLRVANALHGEFARSS